MASIHLPSLKDIAPRRPVDPLVPFILSRDDDYLDLENAYIQARCRGRVDPSDVTADVLSPQPLSFNSSMQFTSFLCDFRTFCETEQFHPDLGVINTEDVREWHILELYADAMHRGLWTAAFFESGFAQPLNTIATINPRIRENMRLFLWLAAKGHVSDFREEPQFDSLRASLAASTDSFVSVGQVSDHSAKRNVRNSPGKAVLPSPSQMIDWMNELPQGAIRLGAIGIHEHGFRRAELCHGLLVEGVEHVRDQFTLRKLNMWHPKWNSAPILLKHDCNDDRMIGVLPRGNWRLDEKARRCKIIGKGNVVRLIHLKAEWLTRVEQYQDTHRAERLARRRDGRRPANLLIDERGSPLSPKAFYTAISRANAKHQRLKITPHVLRHIYACRFLQRAIEVDAHARGLAIAELTRQQIEEFAEMPLDVLRLELGHASVETTRKYVEMLIHDWIAPRYHEAWNSVLDAVE